jgi:hypothetical protein
MECDQPLQWRPGFLMAIIGVALVAIVFTVAFMVLYTWLYNAIWSQNDFVMNHRWTIPVGVLFFSLLVGLSQK